MKTSIALFITLCICSVLVACDNAGNPTSVAQTILENTCQQQSLSYLKFVNFLKTDAVSSKRDGVDYYTIKYDFEVEGTKDGGYLHICRFQGKYHAVMNFEVRNSPKEGDCFVFPVEKGHRYKTDPFPYPHMRAMTLAKHENGWVVDH
jgi:hypothetical protein